MHEKLGRNDPCPCGSSKSFQALLPQIGLLSMAANAMTTGVNEQGQSASPSSCLVRLVAQDTTLSMSEHGFDSRTRLHITKGAVMRMPKRGLHKPRNPLVAPALQRKAGSHEKTHKQDRQKLKAELRRSTDTLH
jgi:hypothetical protein